jgi:hypothetical protein
LLLGLQAVRLILLLRRMAYKPCWVLRHVAGVTVGLLLLWLHVLLTSCVQGLLHRVLVLGGLHAATVCSLLMMNAGLACMVSRLLLLRGRCCCWSGKLLQPHLTDCLLP